MGSGSQDAPLRALAAGLQLRNVTFAGRVPPSEIHRYYADADIYVQAPSIDNMPLSVLEAFASGLPVVSTNVGGVPAMLTHGVHGLLAPANDDQAVAAHVLTLLESPEYARQLAAAAARTCDSYEWPVAREGWLAAYRSVAATAPPDGICIIGMTQVFNRLRRMTRNEVSWRARTAARIAADRITVRVRPRAWHRDDIRAVLAADVLDAPLDVAITAGRWDAVHNLLEQRIRDRQSLFVLDPASAPALRDEVVRRDPSAPARAAERADAILEGRYDLLGYRGLTLREPTAGSTGISTRSTTRAPRCASGPTCPTSTLRSATTRSSGS